MMSEHQNSFTGAVCQHVRLNSERCTQPARRNSVFCRFHDAAMKPLPAAHNLNDQLPVLEDTDSIQIAIMRLLRFLMQALHRPQGHQYPPLRTPTRLHQPRSYPTVVQRRTRAFTVEAGS